MKINLNTLTYPQTNFTGKSKKFKQEYTQRIDDGKLTETQLNNLKGLSERFVNEGLTYPKALKAARINPFLLVLKPETMERNIRETVKRFAHHGLTVESYLHSALKQPVLFMLKPQTIEDNIKNLASMFAYDGMSVEDVFRMAESNSNVYVTKAKTLNKKVDVISKGTNAERYEIVGVFKKHPTTISAIPKIFIKKFEFLRYIEQNKFFDAGKVIPPDSELKSTVLRKSFTNSMELNYLILLRNKISSTLPRGSKLPFDYLEKAISDFIQENHKKTIELKLPDSKYVKEFVKFAKNFSKSAIGENIFRFKVV